MAVTLHPSVSAIQRATSAIDQVNQCINQLGIDFSPDYDSDSGNADDNGVCFKTKLFTSFELTVWHELYLEEQDSTWGPVGYALFVDIHSSTIRRIFQPTVPEDDDNKEDLNQIRISYDCIGLQDERGSITVDAEGNERSVREWLQSIFNMDISAYELAISQDAALTENDTISLIKTLLQTLAPAMRQIMEEGDEL